jgi:hypothetical protein
MALRGTLKDFGIADIFQLIGHQGKTGVLSVKNRDQEVNIYFKDGSVVRAESSTRQKRELLGSMLVRAEVLTDAQLAEALETQQKTLKRLGDILVEASTVDAKTLRAFAKLQTTETIYRLFLWDNGNYEFKQTEVTVDVEGDVIRSENVLMEGFRQVDEWPLIRRRITSYGMIFERLEDLDALSAASSAAAKPATGGDDLGLDDAFGELEGGGSSHGGGDPRLKNIGQNERIVYHLIQADRDVQKLIDLSRLGEFETCKALLTLLEASIIQALPEGHKKPSAEPAVGGIRASGRMSWLPAVTRVALYLAFCAGVIAALWYWGRTTHGGLVQEIRAMAGYVSVDLQTELSQAHTGKIRTALEVFRVETGAYPGTLAELVSAGLLRPRDLSYPWRESYYYARRGDSYELLRPIF